MNSIAFIIYDVSVCVVVLNFIIWRNWRKQNASDQWVKNRKHKAKARYEKHICYVYPHKAIWDEGSAHCSQQSTGKLSIAKSLVLIHRPRSEIDYAAKMVNLWLEFIYFAHFILSWLITICTQWSARANAKNDYNSPNYRAHFIRLSVTLSNNLLQTR